MLFLPGSLRRLVLLTAAALALAPPPSGAQAPIAAAAERGGVAVRYDGRARALRIATPRTSGEIRIDGFASEPAWDSAAVLTGFSQYAPVDGVPAADSTEVRVIYADHAIYFAIRAFEPHGAVIATRADRDKITGDDYV